MDDSSSIAGLRFISSDDIPLVRRWPPTPAKAIEPVPAPPSQTPSTAHLCAYHMSSNPYVHKVLAGAFRESQVMLSADLPHPLRFRAY